MLRMKVLVVSVVLLGALIFGAAIAFAGWGWNSKVNVGGGLISTAWSVDGGNEYFAEIAVTVPDDAVIFIEEMAPDAEKVDLRHSLDLVCTNGIVQTSVSYMVEPMDDYTGAGEAVSVTVSNVETGAVLGTGSGSLGETITVDVDVPGRCAHEEYN